ncbi:MAG: 16S rRNA (adenine(1518)-N(6)/adenine(1519)-N(6))-dimethyltransferase RsmA [Pseudomonadota bacterium]
MRARRRFGQNFLHDPNVIDKIVGAIAPVPGEQLLEIGPGHGAISRPLMTAGAKLTVLEIDRDLVAELSSDPGFSDARIVEGDALDTRFAELGHGPYRVVGNLPYNISSPLLFHCLDQLDQLRDAHFLLQLEVVQRMAAQPGSRVYGRLSVMLQYHCQVRSLFTVAPGAFMPAPKVHSALVRLIPHAKLPAKARSYEVFSRVVSSAFAQRRKQLGNSLRSHLTAAQLSSLEIDPTLRPEQLAPADFVAIANAVTP